MFSTEFYQKFTFKNSGSRGIWRDYSHNCGCPGGHKILKHPDPVAVYKPRIILEQPTPEGPGSISVNFIFK